MAFYRQPEPFYERLAEHMVRNQKDCFASSIELDLELTQDEAKELYQQPGFQKVLETARIRIYSEIGNNPELEKATILGGIYHCAAKLIEIGQYDKAGNQLVNYAKVANMINAESNVNIFASLNGKELAEMKKKLKEEHLEGKGLLN